MRRLAVTLLAAFGIGLLSSPAWLQEKGGVGSFTGPYEIPDLTWPAWAHPYPRAGHIWGSQAGVFAESPNRVYLGSRGMLKLPDEVPPNFPGNWVSSGPRRRSSRSPR